MKSQNKIPTGKVERASRFVRTGVKLGGNYVRHYARRLVDGETSRDELHQDNAEDIYDALSQLKGSALKVAQMMSMDRNVLPQAYQQKFQLSQYSAPPLSGPLVVKIFRQAFGKAPQEVFDRFDMNAVNAASIGQVHQARLGDRKLAVKIQYPGVADSVRSDLKMVRPIAVRMFGLNEQDVDKYMAEVEVKLIEETDYALELRRSQEISAACAHIPSLFFPKYYPEYSAKRVLTMDWIEGKHLGEFLETDPTPEVRDKAGQALWDFYDYQIHTLRQVHADPHPGNFLFQPDGRIGIIDFGCVKEIPDTFYDSYFHLIQRETLDDPALLDRIFHQLEFYHPKDTDADKRYFGGLFAQLIELLGRPFHSETFDFGQDAYFEEIYRFSEDLAKRPEIRHSKVSRGVKDSLYINRTYFGLYSMLNQMKARVRTHSDFAATNV